ncbi:MAG: serine/threonine protein kinase [Polyangiaceae bacterium]|nr:serine/threonine protein kinase [Polyangiaceae bacterium]
MCGATVVEAAASDTEPTSGGGWAGSAQATTAGDYELVQLLGSGTLGRVFRGVRRFDGHVAAIKLLHPHLVRSADARLRFVQEARTLRHVTHPNIGRVLDVLETEGLPTLVLEYYEGQSLRQLIEQRGAFEPFVAISILRCLAQGLGGLHSAGWVHRDVKPENVMVLDPTGAPPTDLRLLDFGLAKSLIPDGSSQTAAGTFVGSLAYAAPEQLFGEAIGPPTDWWALGVVAYEMLSAKRPFEGTTRVQMARNVAGGLVPPIDVSHELLDWIRGLLTRDPAKRPQSAEAVIEGLERVEESLQ